jgi:hypothetical protein
MGKGDSEIEPPLSPLGLESAYRRFFTFMVCTIAVLLRA